ARGFWRGFFTSPKWELPEEQGVAFVRRLLRAAFDVPEKTLADLRQAGFRILPCADDSDSPFGPEGPLPAWAAPFLWARGQQVRAVRYPLTFRPCGHLAEAVPGAYLAG